MDMTLDRDGSGVIGTLFQQIISDMKVGVDFAFYLVLYLDLVRIYNIHKST